MNKYIESYYISQILIRSNLEICLKAPTPAPTKAPTSAPNPDSSVTNSWPHSLKSLKLSKQLYSSTVVLLLLVVVGFILGTFVGSCERWDLGAYFGMSFK